MESVFLWLLRTFSGWWDQFLAYAGTGTSVRIRELYFSMGCSGAQVQLTERLRLVAFWQQWSRMEGFVVVVVFNEHTVWPFSLLEPMPIRTFSIPSYQKREAVLSTWKLLTWVRKGRCDQVELIKNEPLVFACHLLEIQNQNCCLLLGTPHWKLTDSFGEVVENVLRVAKFNINLII